MATIKFSASSIATQTTSITVALGGTPSVGDLVVVFLGTNNEIITHQPGWASEFTANPNPWFEGNVLRNQNNAVLSSWYHTWNAADSGNSVTFTFVPAPSLGIGDKDLSLVNSLAAAIVFDGSLNTAVLENNINGVDGNLVNSVPAQPLDNAATLVLHAAFCDGSTVNLTDSDPTATLVQHPMNPNGPTALTMSVYSRVAPPALYAPVFSKALSPQLMMNAAISVSDVLPQIFNPPYIEEGPMADNRLMFRYRINRYFTVLNNTGTFSAQRYLSTDQFDAATQVFRNNQPISSTDRTNILASGVGGDFRALS
ncbi:MAG TPA: hypothetical protein VIY48_08550 [Candidatus Paceibacterota bacterium]